MNPTNPKNQNFEKMKKPCGDIIILHFTDVYHTQQSYDEWFLQYEEWQIGFFVNLDHFLSFYSPNNPKNQNFEKMKQRPGYIIILEKCTKNHNHALHYSWDIAHEGCNCFSFWAIFCPFTFPNKLKNQNFKKLKKISWRYHHSTQVYQKSSSYAALFVRYGVWWM